MGERVNVDTCSYPTVKDAFGLGTACGEEKHWKDTMARSNEFGFRMAGEVRSWSRADYDGDSVG